MAKRSRALKIIAAILLISIVTIAIVYVLIQTRSSSTGEYYVTAEATIYGPAVDLAAIRSETGGTYASDKSYVRWGTNPFCRVYADNTLQESYHGYMVFTREHYYEHDLRQNFDKLKFQCN